MNSKRSLAVVLFVLAALSVLAAPSHKAGTPGLLPLYAWGMAGDTDLDPVEIIDKVDRMMRGESSQGRVEMTVVTEHWTRSLELEIWSKGKDKALIRILAPKKEEGTATLKVGRDIWNYLPKIDRTIRVPSSMMMGSWMGSHFTNDDLVKESLLAEDYNIKVVYEGVRNEEDGTVWELELLPKPEAPVVWGRILIQVRQRDLMPIWSRYYDEDDVLKRTLTFHDYREMDGRLVPARFRLEPADKSGEYTEMVYHELHFNIDIPDRKFSLSQLRR
ncbi:MAG TPA: outer membrane lipoprotein-sorting protein [Acidobacteriota bacterium]|nr:outer membrane lipoprotein-sorting protein [Acidobacteriota bacterium]